MHLLNLNVYWLWLLLPAFVTPTNPAYDRILNMNYAVRGTDNFGYNDTYFFSLIDRVKPALTSVIPFLLNVDDVSPYQSKLTGLKQKGIAVFPAVGFPNEANMNSATNQKIARVYSGFTDSIRLEIYSGYEASNATLQDVQAFITFLTNTLSFKHIVLNAWPHPPGSANVYPFKSAAVEASQEQDDESNFDPPGARTEAVTRYRPTADIICNYEAPGGQEKLAKLSKAGQENAMQNTITLINKRPAADHLHWMAPFSTFYNPVKQGTYGFIVQKLDAM